MSTQDALSLEPLADAYDVAAELFVRGDSRTFLGTRRADGMGVLIIVPRSPESDERNALTHFGADVKHLSSLRHPNLVPVLEGRWIASDAFALVTERVQAPTLEEVLSRETLAYQRVARILQEVNGLLAWARSQGVVHRAVTWSTVMLQPGSDQVLVSFELRPIPITGVPGAEGDAKTIASLAWSMLARSPVPTDGSVASLADVRPELPTRLVEATEALLHARRNGEGTPDVLGYIALVAMADVLKNADVERERIRTTILSEYRLTRQRLEAEREELDRTVTEERERLAAERLELERQRDELERARAELQEYRAVIEQRLGELEQRHHESVRRPTASAAQWRQGSLRWALPAAAVAFIGIVAASIAGIGMGSYRPSGRNGGAVRIATAVRVDSAAGSIAPLPGASASTPVAAVGATGQAPSSTDSEPPRPRPRRRVVAPILEDTMPVDSAARHDSLPGDSLARGLFARPDTSQRDSLSVRRRGAAARTDSIVRRDSLAKRDSLARRDSVARRDSLVRQRPDSDRRR